MRFIEPLLLLAAAAGAAQAREPVCAPDRAGIVACIAGKLCTCRFERGGSITGLPTGYRWDCGVLRPPCGEAELPATIDAYPYPLPPALSVEDGEHGRRHRDREC